METLHTILLGPYKYLTRMVMGRLTGREKAEVAAKMRDISYSGIRGKVHRDITQVLWVFGLMRFQGVGTECTIYCHTISA